MRSDRLPLLIEPDPRGRVSGGYLFNAKMAEHGAWELEHRTAGELAAAIARGREAERQVLLDSIWLRESVLGVRADQVPGDLGVMLHSFPSMIDAAEAGNAPRPVPTAWEVAVLERVRIVLAPGDHYAKLLDGTGARVCSIAPGIDDEWRLPARAKRGVCRIVGVGAVTPRKGFLDLVLGLSALDPADYELTLVGSLDVDPRYVSWVRAAIQGANVRLLGQQAPHVTRAEVQQADVLAMPSYDENHPLVLLEAMAASVPVVAYAAGAASRMVEHGVSGLVGPIGDRARLALHLRQLIEDEAARIRMAEACWAAQRRFPSWAAAALAVRRAIEVASA